MAARPTSSVLPWPSAASKARRRHSFTAERHGSVTSLGQALSLPGRRKRQLLHSAGPSRPARQQTPTDGQRPGSGCATCFHPGCALLSAAPCSSGSLNPP
jgi:hypothetical protein